MANIDSGWTPEAKAAAEELMRSIEVTAAQEWDKFEKDFFGTKAGLMEKQDTTKAQEVMERLQRSLDAQIKTQGVLEVGKRLAEAGQIGAAESAKKIVQEVRAGEEEIDIEALDKAIKEFEANQGAAQA
jgi:c-di-AMP phosphodiesterase-like protein